MKFLFSIILFALIVAPPASAQTHPAEKKAEVQKTVRVETKVETERETEREAEPAADEDFAVERRVDAAADVALSLCVTSGDVVVRGWDRAEVRARVSESGGVKLDAGGGQPARRVEVVVAEDKEAGLESGGCGSTSTLELMVPRGASVNIQARDGHVEIADVAEAHVQSLSGDVDISRASRSVEVSCLSGDISLEDSSGPVRLAAISGNVEARNVRTIAQGDSFEAKSTSGDVTLEGIAHSQVNGSTVSGGVIYTGALARGGVYDFRTISGDVTLELPADSSFTVHAKVFQGGDIVTDFPIKTLTGTNTSTQSDAQSWPTPPTPPDGRKPGKSKPPKDESQTRLDGTVGTGDAVVNLSSFNGSVRLKRR
ncbi:MAG TPA: DUF4097 family beta strand repeat-containing protein [Pyrinomonadaceae bacterium]|nr:DUF4097 family beta strand repeat-containing protein [Pyrinomonadaceae bacterium]